MRVGLVVTCLAVLLSVVLAASVPGKGGHEFAERCMICHITSETEEPGPALLKAAAVVAKKCEVCHELAANSSHPVGVVVEGHVPEEFPLDESGRLTCLSCHYAHPRPEGALAAKFLLRGVSEPEMLCPQCHMLSESLADHDPHAMAIREAHTRLKDEDGNPSELHVRSADCISCHEDLRPASASGRSTDHPIGVTYPSGRGPGNDFRPQSTLDPAVRLFDGKVECETCHNLFSSIDPYLVMSNQRSKLCLSCHDK